MNENSISDSTMSEEYTQQDFDNEIQYSNARNLIVNQFKNFVNVIEYKRPFFINEGGTSSNVDRRRKFKYDNTGDLQIARDGVTFNDLIDSDNRSRRRALDNFFGYAFSNTWRYFITITFNPNKINRHSREDINYAWKLLRQRLQYRNKDIHILIVSEEHHTDGCLHFHGLLGCCDLTEVLSLGINNKKYLYDYNVNTREKIFRKDKNGNLVPNKYYGCLLKTDFGDQVYNFTDSIFNLGFTTIVELHPDGIAGDNDRVASYLMKYMSKDYNSIGYNKRSYFRTNNLEFKDKYVLKSQEYSNKILTRKININEKYKVKDNDKYTLYRIPKSEFSSVDKLYLDVELGKTSKEDYIKAVVDGKVPFKRISDMSRDAQLLNMLFPN